MIQTRESGPYPPPPPWMDPNLLGATELVRVDVGRICVIRDGIPGLIQYLHGLTPALDLNWDAYILDRPDAGAMYVFSFAQFWLGLAVLVTGRKPNSFLECNHLLVQLLSDRRETMENLSRNRFSEEEIQFALDIHEYARSEEVDTADAATRPAVVLDMNKRIQGAMVPEMWLLQRLRKPEGKVGKARPRIASKRTRMSEPAAAPDSGPEFRRGDFEQSPPEDRREAMFLSFGGDEIGTSFAENKHEDARFVRTPHLKAPKQVTQRQRFSVVVYMDEEKPEESEVSSEIEINVPSEAQRLDFTVWLTGTGHFTIANPMKKLSVVRSKSRSESVAFDVTVLDDIKDDGEAQLLAVFCYNNRACGNVSRSVKVLRENASVIAPSAAAERRSPVLRVDMDARPADLTLVITNPSGDERTFECQISTPLLANSDPEPAKWPLAAKTKDLVDGYFRLFLKPPPQNGENDPTRLAYLRGAGKHLFKATPIRFQEVFWKLLDSGFPLRTISIVTSEPYFPWELILPHRPGEERKVLGVEFAIGRTTSRDYIMPPQIVQLNESWVFAPIYRGNTPPPLAKTREEANFVTTQFRGDVVAPADFGGFENAMQRPRSLVHFVCHGNTTVAGQSIYDYNGTELFSTAFNGGQYTPRAYEKARPFVFLNACKVGQTERSFNGLGGFAPTFLELGASCVIAPLWSVKDTLAHKIAREFYEETAKDPSRPFASILSNIRARAYEKGEDTYAAYCFYGDPLASQR